MLKKKRHHYPGFFISFEGGEGAGKSTQIRNLLQYFKQQKRSVLLTLEPGGTRIGEKIREILLNPANKELGDRAELLLYVADRAQHVEECIIPALKAGKVVITDRYADSSVVYQGLCRKLGLDWTISLNDFATNGLYPDLVFVLDLPESVGLARVRQRIKASRLKNSKGIQALDRMEREKAAFHRQVRRGFLLLSKKYPKRIQVIDASQTESEVAADILKAVASRIKTAKRK